MSQVGRDGELVAVGHALRAGRCIEIVGRPGLGKTRMVEWVVDQLGPGRSHVVTAPRQLAWRALGTIDLMAPVRPPGEQRDALLGVLREMVGGRWIVLDDAQWVDTESASILSTLAREVPMVVASRDRSSIATSSWVTIQLEPLSTQATFELARREHPGAGTTELEAIVEAAGGNPLLISVLSGLDHVASPADLTPVGLVLSHLSDRALETLVRLDIEPVVPDSEVSPDVAGELERHGLARITKVGLSARHALIGEAARELLGPVRLRRLHQQAAGRATDPGARARYLLEAGDPDARQWAERAAELARTPRELAEHLAVASRADPSDGTARLRAARAMGEIGRHDEALKLLDGHDPVDEHRRHHHVLRAWTRLVLHGPAAGEDDIRAGLASEGTDSDFVLLKVLEARSWATHHWDGPAALQSASQALEVARRAGVHEAMALEALGYARFVDGDDQWIDDLRAARSRAEAEGDHLTEVTAANTLCSMAVLAGHADEAAELAGLLERRCREVYNDPWAVHFRLFELIAHFHRAEPPAGLITGFRHVRSSRTTVRQQYLVDSHLAIALGDTGEVEQAASVLSTIPEADDVPAAALRRWAHGEVAFAAGRFTEVDTMLPEGAGTRGDAFPADVLARVTAQWAAWETGADPGPQVEPNRLGLAAAAHLESEGILALIDGQPDTAVASFEKALGVAELRNRRSHLRLRWALGQAVAEAGRGTDAREVLIDVHAIAVEHGRLPLVRRVQRTMRQLGLRPRSPGLRVDPLTPAEVEVLSLVASGLETNAIANRLLVSGSTVDSHVRSAMRKLGATSRVSAAVSAMSGSMAAPANGVPPHEVCANEKLRERRVAGLNGVPVMGLGEVGGLPRSESGVRPVVTGTISDEAHLARAVWLAAGFRLVVTVGDESSVRLRWQVADALSRLGAVFVEEDLDEDVLDEATGAAIPLLAAGASMTDVARTLSMSRRTLERRLARVRRVLGVSTNVEVLARIR